MSDILLDLAVYFAYSRRIKSYAAGRLEESLGITEDTEAEEVVRLLLAAAHCPSCDGHSCGSPERT